jgi:hypothetical protein
VVNEQNAAAARVSVGGAPFEELISGSVSG